MTARVFALAVGADQKWIENTSRLIGRKLHRTEAEARWLGLVRLLTQTLDVSLATATRSASAALGSDPSGRAFAVATNADDAAAIVIDLARYLSSFAASLSAARVLGTSRRRGRPPTRRARTARAVLKAALAYGVDVTLLRATLALSPAARLRHLDRNAASLVELRAGQGAARRARDGRARTPSADHA